METSTNKVSESLKCNHCDKSYKSKQTLNNHMKMHVEIPQVDGACETSDTECSDDQLTMVTYILFTPDCQADWNDKTVKEIIQKRIDAVNLQSEGIEIFRSRNGAFTACKVK